MIRKMAMKLFDEETKQTVEFEIPDEYKRIAVNCSGGADSSILLYTLVKYLQENNKTDTKITVLTCANDLKGRWNARNAAKVIDFVIENTKTNLIDTHISYYRDLQKEEYFHEIEHDLFRNKKIDLVVSGITSNPPTGVLVLDINNKAINLSDEALDVRNSREQETWYYDEIGTWYTPFVNTDKKMISAIYNHFNITETLLPLTRSCESIEKDPKLYDRPCGKCWWCLERKWAFGIF